MTPFLWGLGGLLLGVVGIFALMMSHSPGPDSENDPLEDDEEAYYHWVTRKRPKAPKGRWRS